MIDGIDKDGIKFDFNNENDRNKYAQMVGICLNKFGADFIIDCLSSLIILGRKGQVEIICEILIKHEKMNTLTSENKRLLKQQFINSENYREIVKTHLFAFGIDNLLIIQDKFLEQEQYEKCAVIRDVIKHHNKISNDKLPTVRKQFV